MFKKIVKYIHQKQFSLFSRKFSIKISIIPNNNDRVIFICNFDEDKFEQIIGVRLD